MKKKIIITIIVLALLAGGGYAAWQNPSVRSFIESRLPKAPDTNALYEQSLVDALKYKSEGDSGDPQGYKKAIREYKKAARYSNSWFPYLNAGNVYRLMKEYADAENSYKQGLARQPGEVSLYLAFVELYRYDLEKDESVVIEVYERGLTQIPRNPNLRSSYGAYLRDIGRKADAIKQYGILASEFPEYPQYAEELKRLKEGR